MNRENWDRIIADYKTSWNCLVCPKHCEGWRRDEQKGLFYLLKAYLAAQNEPEKDHLWYARILTQMAFPGHFCMDAYERYHKYIAPAAAEYGLVEDREKYAEEIKRALLDYRLLKVRMDFTGGDWEERASRYMSLIENASLLDENRVWFEDGKVKKFTVNGEKAVLVYDYDGKTVTLEFDGVINVETSYNTWDYINDFECYPLCPERSDDRVFDIGTHRITCGKIRVVSVER